MFLFSPKKDKNNESGIIFWLHCLRQSNKIKHKKPETLWSLESQKAEDSSNMSTTLSLQSGIGHNSKGAETEWNG